jgi:hypothetical protein
MKGMAGQIAPWISKNWPHMGALMGIPGSGFKHAHNSRKFNYLVNSRQIPQTFPKTKKVGRK